MKFFYLTLLLITLLVNISSRLRITKKRFTKYLNRFQDWPNHALATPDNDWGNSATIYLDRHNVDCGIGALASFQLKRPNAHKIKFDYKCILPKSCINDCQKNLEKIDGEKCKKLSTPANILGNETGKSINYLDRHTIKCPTGYVLTHFHLLRVPPKIKFDYTCCPATVKDCTTKNTTETDFVDYGIVYLERQNVEVPDIKTQALTGFKLHTDYGRHSYFYEMFYCTVIG